MKGYTLGASALEALRKLSNLEAVWDRFWRGNRRKSAAGIDGITPFDFRLQRQSRLRDIHFELGESYTFSGLRGIVVPKKDVSKFRLICVPTVADRLVQRALLEVIENDAARLRILNDVSYGFVRNPGGVKRGVHGAHQLSLKLRHEAPWAFKADISKFFDTIPREPLVEEFCRAFRLRSLSPLVRGVIGCEVIATGERVKAAIGQNGIKKGLGLRQGMPLSPILSNFVLRTFDEVISANLPMVRYADDLVVFATSEEACKKAENLVTVELEKLKLELSKDKSYICKPNEPVEFLGMELGLSQTGKYQLVISAEQMKATHSAFTRYHDVSLLNADNLDASKLYKRLDQMRTGYMAAYGAADNFKELERRLTLWTRNCIYKVYASIFTPELVSKLSVAQKKFLMIH